jgi:BlaI family penicillinase repressor
MKFSDAEWQLMNALWQKYPATAREVMDNIPNSNTWAYTTVKTMLTRLVDKKAISETKQGNISVYEPLVSQQSARKSALQGLVDKVLGGTVEPIMHFLVEEKKLSVKDRQKLIEFLEKMDEPTREANDDTHE